MLIPPPQLPLTWLIALGLNAAGFIAQKHYVCGRITSYRLEDMKTGAETTVARLASLPLPEDWGDDFSHGPFRMSEKAFLWAQNLLEKAKESEVAAFFIDELGKVELGGKGHAELIRKALNTGMDIYISVRDTNVEKAVKTFNLKEYQVIPAV